MINAIIILACEFNTTNFKIDPNLQDETGFNFETVAEADGSYELELDAGTWTLSAGPDSSCFGDETEVDIGCDPATVDLSVISCMGR